MSHRETSSVSQRRTLPHIKDAMVVDQPLACDHFNFFFLKKWSHIAQVALELLRCQGSSPVSASMEIGLQAALPRLFNVVLGMEPRASCVPDPLPAELRPKSLFVVLWEGWPALPPHLARYLS